MWDAWEVGLNGKPSMLWLEDTFPPSQRADRPAWRLTDSSTRRAWSEYRMLLELIYTFGQARRITPAHAAQIIAAWQAEPQPLAIYVNSLHKLRQQWLYSHSFQAGIRVGRLEWPTPKAVHSRSRITERIPGEPHKSL